MKQYELLCVLPGTLAESEVGPIAQEIEQTIISQGATEVVLQDLGKSRLAYPVKHIRYGYFELFTLNLEATKLQSLERAVRLIQNLLRVVVRVKDPKTVGKTISLAVDPTALSAPKKEEVRRERIISKPAPKKEVETVEKAVEETAAPALNLENIDEKLDEILQKDIDKV